MSRVGLFVCVGRLLRAGRLCSRQQARKRRGVRVERPASFDSLCKFGPERRRLGVSLAQKRAASAPA